MKQYQLVDGFTPNNNSVKVHFKDDRKSVSIPIALIKDMVCMPGSSNVDVGVMLVSPEGKLHIEPQVVSFDQYMQSFFEAEAIHVLSFIVHELKLSA